MITIKKLVDYLNELARMDPGTIHAMFNVHWPAGQPWLDHPSAVCGGAANREDFPEIGFLGVLQGIAELTGEGQLLVLTTKEEGQLVSFTATSAERYRAGETSGQQDPTGDGFSVSLDIPR